MAFVHVKYRRLHTEFAKQAHPPNAQQDFLHHSGCAIAAVDPEGQVAKMLLIFRTVRVKEVNGHPSKHYSPGLKSDLIHPDLYVANQRLAFLIEHWLHRQILWI